LHSFACASDGGAPFSVIVDRSGNLYGTASVGGTNNNGLIYEVSNSGQYSVIYTFCSTSGCADGSSPSGGLLMDTAGTLFGTTVNGGGGDCSLGCGTVFTLMKTDSSWNEEVIHSFTGSDGGSPSDLTMGNGGERQIVIFGTTSEGGSGLGGGTVFRMSQTKSGYELQTLHSFTGSDGQIPYDPITLVKGKVFGTTSYAGSGGSGTVFALTRTKEGWTEDTLYSFTGGSDGGESESGVVADSTGRLYGTARYGGNSACYPMGCGIVFEIVP